MTQLDRIELLLMRQKKALHWILNAYDVWDSPEHRKEAVTESRAYLEGELD